MWGGGKGAATPAQLACNAMAPAPLLAHAAQAALLQCTRPPVVLVQHVSEAGGTAAERAPRALAAACAACRCRARLQLSTKLLPALLAYCRERSLGGCVCNRLSLLHQALTPVLAAAARLVAVLLLLLLLILVLLLLLLLLCGVGCPLPAAPFAPPGLPSRRSLALLPPRALTASLLLLDAWRLLILLLLLLCRRKLCRVVVHLFPRRGCMRLGTLALANRAARLARWQHARRGRRGCGHNASRGPRARLLPLRGGRGRLGRPSIWRGCCLSLGGGRRIS